MLPENLLPYKIKDPRSASSPRKSGILPVNRFSSNIRLTKLTKFLIPEGNDPEIWFRLSDRLLSWVERLFMEAGRAPLRSFPASIRCSSKLQFVKEEMNSQSSASMASRLLVSTENSVRYGRLPRLAGIAPLKLLPLSSIC
ncbi:hypothetical protein MUK42_04552 [Musa troglodytarum]|uniref:Uncharacterized protein n=1 Tax=Musa troglodytarum TaxID=320322 RepID=A0A9E7GH17_9LILI|nr:hypothetical protein MUK42_04552 [Musa troglodytarum]